ncbi:MAG: YqiJ family protein [Cyanothece sp. SIO2G6]|nr:YqiJ family protein [Cyanothece sp. SIO2G6]
MLFSIENLPYWIFLGAGTLLFGLVIVSGGGDDDVDADIDTDLDLDADIDVDMDAGIDVDADIDADLDADVDAPSGRVPGFAEADPGPDGEAIAGSGFTPLDILGWLGVGKAPIILLLALDLCLWGLLGWMATVILGGLLRFIPFFLLRIPILLGSMVAALLIGGQIARPIGKIFSSFGESASADRLVGCTGKVSSARLHNVSTGKIAQVDVVDPAKNLVTVNAVLPIWAKNQPTIGEKVLVIERSDKAYLYFVIAKDSEDEEQWFSVISPAKSSR